MSALRVGAVGGVSAVVLLALPFVASFEGLRNSPYRDLIGKPTVCFGETQVLMRRYTTDECRDMLSKSLERYASGVMECLPTTAPVEVKAAFASFAYNAGTKAACGSTAARRARAGNYADACDALMAWVYAGGVKVAGLVKRRAAERELCLRGT